MSRKPNPNRPAEKVNEHKKYMTQWNDENRDVVNSMMAEIRCKKAGTYVPLSAIEEDLVQDFYRYAVNLKRITDKNYEVDHILPINVGGTNELNNLRILLKSDNMKRPKDGSDFGRPIEGEILPSDVLDPQKLEFVKYKRRRYTRKSVKPSIRPAATGSKKITRR